LRLAIDDGRSHSFCTTNATVFHNKHTFSLIAKSYTFLKHCNVQRDGLAALLGEPTAPGDLLQYTRKREKGKSMNLKDMLEELKQLPPATQVALVLLALVLLLLLAFVPTVGTSILAFLIAFKTLTTR
jgi:hypothetical protein